MEKKGVKSLNSEEIKNLSDRFLRIKTSSKFLKKLKRMQVKKDNIWTNKSDLINNKTNGIQIEHEKGPVTPPSTPINTF